jgi:pimeloyl-ACP methyl ester carboxylesterase
MNVDHATVVERFMAIGGAPTRVLEVEGNGPPILLLHGFTDSADSFRPLLSELATRSRRAVAVDLPGGGHAPPLGRPALSSLDRFTDEFVRAFACGEGAVLVGNSLGGLMALRAATRPNLPLAAVAGLGPAGLAYHPRLESLARWVSKLDPILSVLDLLPLPKLLLRQIARTLYDRRLARGRGTAPISRLYASHIHGRRDITRIRRDLIALTQEDNLLDLDTLGEVRVPALLVWGDADRLADVSGAPRLLDAVATSRLVVLDDCGHCPHVEFPKVVAQLITALPGSAIPPATDDLSVSESDITDRKP